MLEEVSKILEAYSHAVLNSGYGGIHLSQVIQHMVCESRTHHCGADGAAPSKTSELAMIWRVALCRNRDQ